MIVEYRIEYTLKRRAGDAADFVEIGFGSSGIWDDLDQAAHMVATDIQNQAWETTDGMPEPGDA